MNYREKMEKKLGRKLKSTEIVHHKDGDQHNDDIENIELVLSQKLHNQKKHRSKQDWEAIVEAYIRAKDKIDARDLNADLDLFFTSRQKEIIFRKLLNKPLTKTEREYFSRRIKKKLIALSNTDLHKAAQLIAY